MACCLRRRRQRPVPGRVRASTAAARLGTASVADRASGSTPEIARGDAVAAALGGSTDAGA